MAKLEIIYMFEDEETHFMSPVRGFRNHVFIRLESDIFHLNIFHIVRLNQEFEFEIKKKGYYSIKENIILVKDVTKEEIAKTVLGLYEGHYFRYIKPYNPKVFQELLNREGMLHSIEVYDVPSLSE